MLKKLILSLLLASLGSSYGAASQKSVRFKDIRTLKLDSISADIQFLLSSDNDVSVMTEQENSNLLKFASEKGTLTISHNKTSVFPPKVRITIPSTLTMYIDVHENSHIFVPEMNSPIKVTGREFSEVTIKGCKGLSVTLTDKAQVQIIKINGDMVTTLSNSSQLGIKEGEIKTAYMTVTDKSLATVAATILALKLETKGASQVKLKHVAKALSWASRGNETVGIHTLTGVADVSANYDSKLYVQEANLDTLLAAAAATGKIKILGTVKNAALSARGAGEIIVDKITGKILRKSQMHKGTIRILNP